MVAFFVTAFATVVYLAFAVFDPDVAVILVPFYVLAVVLSTMIPWCKRYLR